MGLEVSVEVRHVPLSLGLCLLEAAAARPDCPATAEMEAARATAALASPPTPPLSCHGSTILDPRKLDSQHKESSRLRPRLFPLDDGLILRRLA